MSPAATLAGADGEAFFRAWLSDPFAIGAVAPSGAALASLITSRIGTDTGPVVELGPGTGAFTRALLGRGLEPQDLLMIEQSPAFTLLLRRRFPGAHVICDRAEALERHASARLTSAPGAVVSGLPILTMSAASQMRILRAARAVLRPDQPGRPGGAFYQFTYGHVLPIRREVVRRLGFKASCIGRTVRNLPPASVYELRMPAGGREADGRR